MSDVRTIRVFIASPGDLAVERAAFKQVLEELNAGFGDALDIKFEPLGWEDTLASTGRRSQGVINREIDRCDVFILACAAGGGRRLRTLSRVRCIGHGGPKLVGRRWDSSRSRISAGNWPDSFGSVVP